MDNRKKEKFFLRRIRCKRGICRRWEKFELPECKQRFRPSTLEVLIGSLIVLGLFYLGYLVLARDNGDSRKLAPRLKSLEAKVVQQEEVLDKGLQSLKPTLQQLETRLKTIENQQKQLDIQLKQIQAKATVSPPRLSGEERKPTPAAATGKERTGHKVKKGENIALIAKKYHVTPQEILQWNKLPPNPALKVGDILIINKR